MDTAAWGRFAGGDFAVPTGAPGELAAARQSRYIGPAASLGMRANVTRRLHAPGKTHDTMKADTTKAKERDQLLRTLQTRFEQHPERHPVLAWADVLARLESQRQALEALVAMEQTGGEPDVIGPIDAAGRVTFCDCSAESPTGRRSLCYDQAALDARKEHKPRHSAVALAADMGIELLTEAQYRALQELGSFDTKTSSWIETPPDVRSLGGALFCDRRYGRVFVYHNGAQSYYAARGFRGWLRV
jgi:hypothetical protein